MDLFRRTAWLRVLTVLLVGLGSTAVAAQPHGPSTNIEAGVAGDGVATARGLSPVVAANAIGLLVEGDEREAAASPSGAAPSSPALPARTPHTAVRVRWAYPSRVAERPLRHQFCVYRL